MTDDDFDADVVDDELEDLDELAEDLDDDLAEDLAEDLDVDVLDEDLDDTLGTTNHASTLATDEDEDEDIDVLELDEELHPDDVEAPLDALLQERTASATLEDEEDDVEDEEADVDDRGDGTTRIVPRRPGEFLCSSCFLVLPRHQLADEERMLCRDCA
jgi:hypothetical protein